MNDVQLMQNLWTLQNDREKIKNMTGNMGTPILDEAIIHLEKELFGYFEEAESKLQYDKIFP